MKRYPRERSAAIPALWAVQRRYGWCTPEGIRQAAAVMGVTPDVQPDLDSVRTFSFDEGFFRKLFFLEDRLVGAIMIGPPKGRKKLIEIMRSMQVIEGPREDLLDPTNLK